MKRISHKATAAMFFTLGLTSVAVGQSFNIDLDVLSAPPELGGGVPSSGFGAAAWQPGFWNKIGGLVGSPIPLDDLEGNATGATIMKTADHPGGVGAFFFPGNTGDYALLLNDAEQVATLGPGGTLTYTFSGLAPGEYDIYTYAVHIAGLMSNTPVLVPEASHSNTQVVTGPMPGNAFEYLITHSIHHVVLGIPGEFHVSITQPPNHPQGMNVNGFQIVMVPEPSSALAVAFGTVIVLFRFNKSRRRREGYGFGYGEA